MQALSRPLYDAAQVRELDRRAMAELGIGGRVLMQRAAAACWATMQRHWPALLRVGIVCGSGNNGGDGYELARLLRSAGVDVEVRHVGRLPSADAAVAARRDWLAEGGSAQDFDGRLPAVDLWVDALFGIGFRDAPDGAARAVIASLNAEAQAGIPVLAVDIPSGLDASTGAVPGLAVQATRTLSFIADKLGLHTGAGVDHAGHVEIAALDLPEALALGLTPRAVCMRAGDLLALAPRRPNAHKGQSGHVLLVGGNAGMTGAVLLAGRAALRSGAGLVSIATRGESIAGLVAAQPELMVHAVQGAADLAPLLARVDVVALGPGLGEDAWARELWAAVIASGRPLVLDADALNLLARVPRRLDDAVLTPHPGEAGRLLAVSTAQIQADRLSSLTQLEARYGATVVLKGAGSLVSGTPPWLCPYGNPGMAVGGSGDALTGIVAALRAQGLDGPASARLGVLAHALAGDRAASSGQRGLLPSDLIDELRGVFRQ